MTDGPERSGYGRPPVRTRFKPGVSGNPSGRPKGAKSFAAELRDELAELVELHDGAKAFTVSKQRVVVKNLVEAAMKGEPRATAIIVGFCARASTEVEVDQSDGPEDVEIMRALGAPRKPGST
jgi:hypothetical protein